MYLFYDSFCCLCSREEWLQVFEWGSFCDLQIETHLSFGIVELENLKSQGLQEANCNLHLLHKPDSLRVLQLVYEQVHPIEMELHVHYTLDEIQPFHSLKMGFNQVLCGFKVDWPIIDRLLMT